MRANEAYMREREGAFQEWHPKLSALGMRQEHAVARYLVAGEQVQEWVKLPAIDERSWWQRLGIGAREQPPAVLVRTNRQVLLVKETKRIVRGEVTYGSDAWILPQRSLREAYLFAGQNRQVIRFQLERAGGLPRCLCLSCLLSSSGRWPLPCPRS
jgi:hypothetical protein